MIIVVVRGEKAVFDASYASSGETRACGQNNRHNTEASNGKVDWWTKLNCALLGESGTRAGRRYMSHRTYGARLCCGCARERLCGVGESSPCATQHRFSLGSGLIGSSLCVMRRPQKTKLGSSVSQHQPCYRWSDLETNARGNPGNFRFEIN